MVTINTRKEIENARGLAAQIPPLQGKFVVTQEEISQSVDQILMMGVYSHLDRGELIRELSQFYWIKVVGEGGGPVDTTNDHEPWFPNKRGVIVWNYWDRYYKWLEVVQHRPPKVLVTLKSSIEQVMELIDDPDRKGPWRRRGLVVGDVQSGKTSHYIGLVNMAIDAGYKKIIVLAGLTSNLRSQTQIRFDEGVYGWETALEAIQNKTIGNNPMGVADPMVCRDPMGPLYPARPRTSRAENGDFLNPIAQAHGGPLDAIPEIFVIKKNKTVLDTLDRWLKGKLELQNIDQFGEPLLLIDDEADHASINTKTIPTDEDDKPIEDYNPTPINLLIRKILAKFSRNAMVGYTATPFANFFIDQGDPNELEDLLRNDLFPSDFIWPIASPSDHIGPEQLMGIGRYFEETDLENGPIDGSGPLGLLRNIEDSVELEHKNKEFTVAKLPESLIKAVNMFFLSCAAREWRGYSGQHNTMLVHVTRYQKVQAQLHEKLNEYLITCRNKITAGDKDFLQELRRLWETDYCPTSEWLKDNHKNLVLNAPAVPWDDLLESVDRAVSSIVVHQVNGLANDTLIYKDHPDGLNVIAVGGDKLSRGLTLEGLTINYFLRTAKAYDTLMQMGRWFGYRPGYLDLCRVYSTDQLFDDFSHVAGVEMDVREQLSSMAFEGKTPREFCISVQKHPGNMIITAYNRMKNGVTTTHSYSGKNQQAVTYSKNHDEVIQNSQRLSDFLETKCSRERMDNHSNGSYIFKGINGQDIADLLWKNENDRLLTLPSALSAVPSYLSRYVKDRMADDELTQWTLALISVNRGKPATINDLPLRLSKRTNLSTDSAVYMFKSVLSSRDELLDLSLEEQSSARNKALEMEQNAWEKGPKIDPKPEDSGKIAVAKVVQCARSYIRDPKNGLLIVYPLDPEEAGLPESLGPIIGWAISFPRSPLNPAVEHVVNKKFIQDRGFVYGQ